MVEIMIYSYMFICVAMIFYNISFIMRSENGKKRRKSKTKKEIEELIKKIESLAPLQKSEEKNLIKKLSSTENLIIFESAVNEIAKSGDAKLFNYLTSLSTVFSELIFKYSKKDTTSFSYFAYFIAKFRICRNMIYGDIEFLVEKLLQSNSLYCRENALNVVYVFGNVELLKSTLKSIDKSKEFYHASLITDGLLTFEGNHKDFISSFLENRNEYSSKMQVIIFDYIRFYSNEYKEIMLKILKDENEDDEVRFSAIRYFAKYYYKDAEDTLLFLADERNTKRWEFSALSAKALNKYKSDNSIKVLEGCLYSSSWYIRYNASETLENYGLSYNDFLDVFDGNDKFAKEILNYRFDRQHIKEVLEE